MKYNDTGDLFDRVMRLPCFCRIYGFYSRHKPVLLYLLFGGLTTLISIGAFILLLWVGFDALLANVLSWVLAVSFAYLTNRAWVFASQARTVKEIFKEAGSFFGGRLLTLAIEEMLILVFVTYLALDAALIKVSAQILVLLLNYLISKLMVFRTKNQQCQ